jgi:hypothetical protein
MTWQPNPTVTIDGVDYTDDALIGVQLSLGRNIIWEQPRSGYATINLLNITDTNYGIEIRDSVVITVEDSSGNPVTLFTGKVANVANQVSSYGDLGSNIITQVSAISPLSEMARINIGGSSYPAEYDDDRLARILTEAGVSIDIIDSPGVYQFIARPGNVKDAYSLASSYAAQAFGYIYETPTGEVGYANESRRTLDAQLGYLEIPGEAILAGSVQSERTVNNLLNDVTIVYDGTNEVSASDATSIANFGKVEVRIETELGDLDEAQNQANRYITLRAFPETNLSAVSVRLDNENLLNVTRDALLNIYLGKPVRFLDLPNAIYPNSYSAFVEGWQFAIDRVKATLSIITTENSLSITPTRWQDVAPTLAWEDVDPTIQWFAYE